MIDQSYIQIVIGATSYNDETRVIFTLHVPGKETITFCDCEMHCLIDLKQIEEIQKVKKARTEALKAFCNSLKPNDQKKFNV